MTVLFLEGIRKALIATAVLCPLMLLAISYTQLHENAPSRSMRLRFKQIMQPRRSPNIYGSNNNLSDNGDINSNVLVVISSDRMDGIITTLASVIQTSSRPVDVVLIGDLDINKKVQRHFGKRIHHFTSWTVDNVKADLEQQGLRPIWTWDDWHASINQDTGRADETWVNENTVHVGDWDYRMVHALELNHLRFYLPHLSIFENRESLYFIDDDILVRSDLGVMAETTMAELATTKGFVTPCNIWKWNNECNNFRFSSQEESILETTQIYGNSKVCQHDDESSCVPASYQDFLDTFLPSYETGGGGDEQQQYQLAWNFGFSLFALENWRNLQLTERYEAVMRESYRLHVYPETSLAFGLGVSFIAFAGAVECWNESKVKVRDGFGFIDFDRFEETFGKDFLDTIDVIHYTGSAKPWVAHPTIGERSMQPWLDVMEQENMAIPPQLPGGPTTELFTLIGSEQADVSHIVKSLDRHPQICAPGEASKPEIGFPDGIMEPDGLPWFPVCSIKRGCTYAFVRDGIMDVVKDLDSEREVPRRCQSDYDATNDLLDRHLPAICNFVAELNGNFTGASIARVWVDAFQKEDKRFLGCGCKRGALVKGVAIRPDWLLQDATGKATLELSETALVGSKVIRIKRRNLWARVKSRLMDENTNIWNPRTIEEKQKQLELLEDFEVNIHYLKGKLLEFHEIDNAGDEWAKAHASEVLLVEYEECRASATDCIGRICEFLGVERSQLDDTLLDSIFSPVDLDSSLNYITNKEEVKQALKELDLGSAVEIDTAA